MSVKRLKHLNWKSRIPPAYVTHLQALGTAEKANMVGTKSHLTLVMKLQRDGCGA